MMDNELMNKFDRLEALPISEEMLGAYLENNLHGSESREIKNLINGDTNISDLVSAVEADMDFINELNFSFENGVEASFYCDEIFGDISLPEPSSIELQSFTDLRSPLSDEIIIDGQSHNMVVNDHFIHSEDNDHDHHLNHQDPGLDAGIFDNY